MSEPLWLTEKRKSTIGILAGPLGFYGRVYDLWFGPLRQDKNVAFDDAAFAADCIDNASTGVMV